MNKKFFIGLFISMMALLISGCTKTFQDDDIKDVWDLTLRVSEVDKNDCTLKLEFIKGDLELDGELDTGDYYALYKMNHETDEYEKVEPIVEACFDDIAYIIKNDKTTTLDVNYKYLYGELAPGNYKIEKEVHLFKGTGNYEKGIYEATFDIRFPER